MQHKQSVHIEAKAEASIQRVPIAAGQYIGVVEGLGSGEEELKHMPTGFNIKPQTGIVAQGLSQIIFRPDELARQGESTC